MDKKTYLIPSCLKEDIMVEDKMAYFIFELQQKAAIVIQSVWRGYISRKKYSLIKTDLRKNRAALKIQRAVREWFHRKHAYLLRKKMAELEPITEEKLKSLQEEIKQWQDSQPKTKFRGMAQLQEEHREVQNKLGDFYKWACTGKNRDKQTEEKCAHIEALETLLQDSPSLKDSTSADLSFYHCLPLEHAALARIKHKTQMKALDNVWWKNLELCDEHLK